MKQYLQVIKNTWAETMVYRLNFVLWRVRTVVRLFVLYFLWQAIFAGRGELFGYQQAQIMTYVLGSQIVSSFVFSTRTTEIGRQIHQGDLTNFLLRPINYFYYLISRDIADKLLNIFFAVIEISLIIIIFRPNLIWITNLVSLIQFIIALGLAIFMYFSISVLLGFISFWTQESWAPRFLFFIISEFLSGGLFPLDILPATAYQILTLLPFSYLLFFPLKIYLGQWSAIEIFWRSIIGVIWMVILVKVMGKVWKQGLRLYTAEGR